MDQKQTILVAPLLKNSSCDNANATTFLANLGATDVIQAFFIMTLTIAIVGSNLVVIIVINCRRYASFIHPQVRVELEARSHGNSLTLTENSSFTFSPDI
jgi:predicted signal transduction protein with EAL and GGDEF domain